MRKQKLLLAALFCALVFSGCKKKEPTDLSSLHTTAAIEKETMPPTTEAADTTAPETTADDSKEQGSQYAIKTVMKSVSDKKSSVEYPEITGMKDTDKQKKVNEVLKSNAESVKSVCPVTGEGQSLSVKAAVVSSNLRRITVTYKGVYQESSDKTANIFYTNTVNLETAENLRLSDYADAYTVSGYIASGDYKLEATSGTDEQAIRTYINTADKTTDYYYNLLKEADFPAASGSGGAVYTAQTWPKVFSYEKEGTIYLSIPVPDELGSYVMVRYNPDNK